MVPVPLAEWPNIIFLYSSFKDDTTSFQIFQAFRRLSPILVIWPLGSIFGKVSYSQFCWLCRNIVLSEVFSSERFWLVTFKKRKKEKKKIFPRMRKNWRHLFRLRHQVPLTEPINSQRRILVLFTLPLPSLFSNLFWLSVPSKDPTSSSANESN